MATEHAEHAEKKVTGLGPFELFLMTGVPELSVHGAFGGNAMDPIEFELALKRARHQSRQPDHVTVIDLALFACVVLVMAVALVIP